MLPARLNLVQSLVWIVGATTAEMDRTALIKRVDKLASRERGDPSLFLTLLTLQLAQKVKPEEKILLAGGRKIEVTVGGGDVASDWMAAERLLLSTLKAGIVRMQGRKLGQRGASLEPISDLDCEQIRFQDGPDSQPRAVIVSDDRTFWDMLRLDSKDIEQEWPVDPPARRPSSAAAHDRRRGSPPVLQRSVAAAMREAVKQGVDLSSMKEEAMRAYFGASRYTCRKARDLVLSEIVGDSNSDQQRPSTNSDKH